MAFPCVCGHRETLHYKYQFLTDIVMGCRKADCYCKRFKPDNLLYLEQETVKKILG
jgi:hypothetical protein